MKGAGRGASESQRALGVWTFDKPHRPYEGSQCHSERSEESRSDCFPHLRPGHAALSLPSDAQVPPMM